MNKEDIKVGAVIKLVSSLGAFDTTTGEQLSQKSYDPYLRKITEITDRGFKYELVEKELYPNGIPFIPRWGFSFTGEGESLWKVEGNEYALELYELIENESGAHI